MRYFFLALPGVILMVVLALLQVDMKIALGALVFYIICIAIGAGAKKSKT